MSGAPAEVFVDTSGWYAVARAAMPQHEAAVTALRGLVRQRCRLVTTSLVVAETQVLLLRRAGREAALRFVSTVRQPPNLVVWSTAELEERAVAEWLEPFADQDFSLTDAVSFSVMRERGIEVALAFDRHFAVAGYQLLAGGEA